MLSPKQNPTKFRSAETAYARALRKVAAHVGTLIGAFPPGSPGYDTMIRRALLTYADTLGEWAHFTAARMLSAVHKADERAWATMAQNISRGTRDEIQNAPTGHVLKQLLADQVNLIQSIPREAADRVHKLSQEALSNSSRADELVKEIMRTGEVTKSRATLIALTETSRASSVLTQARAKHVGSDGYIWRTSQDSRVRPSHKHMNGKFVRWNEPPTLDSMQGHAGCLPRCRCYPEPVIPE